jgi:hypothetical protein
MIPLTADKAYRKYIRFVNLLKKQRCKYKITTQYNLSEQDYLIKILVDYDFGTAEFYCRRTLP